MGHPGLAEGRPACWALPLPEVARDVGSVLDPTCGGAVLGPGLVCCERGSAEGARLVVGGAVPFPPVVVPATMLGLVSLTPLLGLHANGFFAVCASAPFPVHAGASVIGLADFPAFA